MSVYVFVGPTLSRAEVERELEARCLPPVAQGDVLALLRRDPSVIVIIDGYFERVPAVWHKEILMALHAGVRVVGAASMGALRAAELHSFGMEGVGEVFRSFRDGELEDDDEVAVRHAPAEHGYRSMSEAMVNMRATLKAAVQAGALSRALEEQLLGLARATPYGERSYPALWEAASACGVPEAALAPIRAFAARSPVDQKRLDALAALRHVASGAPRPPTPEFSPAYTFTVDRLLDAELVLTEVDGVPVTPADVIGLTRLCAPDAAGLRARARATQIAVTAARALGIRISAEELQQGVNRFRMERGLRTARATREWMQERDLTPADLAELVEEDLLVERAGRLVGEPGNRALIRELVREEAWPEARDRLVHAGRRAREDSREPPPLVELAALAVAELSWLHSDDPGALVEELGFADEVSLERALQLWWRARTYPPSE